MSKLGLNVGSGQRRFSTTNEVRWINIDKVSRPGMEPDLVCDGSSIPRADNSADYFVLSQVAEHFGCGECKDLITEAYRVLRPGGSLILSVPNMRALAIRWLEGNMDTQLYMTSVYGAWMGNEEDRHKWGYDGLSLAHFLMQGEWRVVRAFDWRPISGMDLAWDWWILGMECMK